MRLLFFGEDVRLVVNQPISVKSRPQAAPATVTDACDETISQCIATWQRPQRPDWMDEATYAEMPHSIDVRLVESINERPGQRTEKLTIATTLLDHKLYDAKWLAGIYRGRWRVELDNRTSRRSEGPTGGRRLTLTP